MPVFRADGNIVQVFFSEYSLNTLVRTLIDINWFEYTVYETSDNIEALLQDFEWAFGSCTKCALLVKPIREFNRTLSNI